MKRSCHFSAYSESGLLRSNNEDNLFCNGVNMTVFTRERPFFLNGTAESPCIFAVCDGMGGEDEGELASLETVKILAKHSEKIKSASKSNEQVNKAVQNFIDDANKNLCDIMRSRYIRLGTTLALVIISEDFIKAYNIGDSRIYKFQDGSLTQLSEDHTVAQQKIKIGLLTEQQAKHDKSRHILTRCLGTFDDEMILTPDIITPFRISKNVKLLLCSDGLTDMVDDDYIQNVMQNFSEPEKIVNLLVNKALENGGRDNITCIVIALN